MFNCVVNEWCYIMEKYNYIHFFQKRPGIYMDACTYF